MILLLEDRFSKGSVFGKFGKANLDLEISFNWVSYERASFVKKTEAPEKKANGRFNIHATITAWV